MKDPSQLLAAVTAYADAIQQGNFDHVVCVDEAQLQPVADALNASMGHLKSAIDTQNAQHTLEVRKLAEAQSQMKLLLTEIKNKKELSDRQANDLQKYQLAVENASDHIVITDADGMILYANKAVERITGYARSEIIGTKAGVRWGKLMSTQVYETLWAEIKQHKRTFQDEFTNRRKNGQKYIAEAKISPVLDNTGNVIFFVGIERDVTKLREVDRMKSEFISLASHQLRTPLSAIKWFLEMLLAGDIGTLTPAQKQILHNIDESNEHMIELVNALLNVSRIESGTMVMDAKPTDLLALVKELLAEMDRYFTEKGQTYTVDSPDTIPQVMVDGKLIRQVYMNLLTNASKYSPAGTQILITLSTHDKMVESQVQDSGRGVPLADQDKIFQKFFRASNVTDQESDSNGLGLYLVKSIVESSGGKIWFTSEEGKGTTFKFTLPT